MGDSLDQLATGAHPPHEVTQVFDAHFAQVFDVGLGFSHVLTFTLDARL